MKLFECQSCGQLLFFENTRCERCGHALGYLPDSASLSALTPEGGDLWRPLARPEETFRYCANSAYDACNWLLPGSESEAFCKACRLNRTLPPLAVAENVRRWQRIERAKRRLVYSLLRLGLPILSKTDDLAQGLAFDFLEGSAAGPHQDSWVVTGHVQGLITLDIAEADDAERERHRQNMAEPYRTLLGHFRHEVGHYYWERLVRNSGWHYGFQGMFGDERSDYSGALSAYYANGPQANWREHFVSAYACSHPWEDFAETWAHYLHIVDTLETAQAFGLHIRPMAGNMPELATEIDFDPYQQKNFDALVAAWLPLTYAVNSLNQSMGQADLYPFVLAPHVLDKLRFIHDLIGGKQVG